MAFSKVTVHALRGLYTEQQRYLHIKVHTHSFIHLGIASANPGLEIKLINHV